MRTTSVHTQAGPQRSTEPKTPNQLLPTSHNQTWRTIPTTFAHLQNYVESILVRKYRKPKKRLLTTNRAPPSNGSSNFSHPTHIFPELLKRETKNRTSNWIVSNNVAQIRPTTHSLQIPSCRRVLRIQCSKNVKKPKTWH